MTNTVDLDELRKNAEAATKGRWELKSYDTLFAVKIPDDIEVVATSWHSHLRSPYPLKAEARANAAYIVAAQPQVVLALIDRIAELEGAIDKLLAHWDVNGREKMGVFEGGAYWSPSARMVETQFIVELRQARANSCSLLDGGERK